MKLTCFVLIMVTGICTAKSLGRTQRKTNEGEESSPNDIKSMQMGQENRNGRLIRESKIKLDVLEGIEDVKNRLSQVKDSVSTKLSDIWNKLTDYYEAPTGELEVSIDTSNLPTLPDPFEITQLHETYTLGDVNFSNIELRGLSTFREAKLRINREKKMATLYLIAKEMQLKGKYELTSKVKNTMGDFQVNIYNNVTYRETITYEAEKGSFEVLSFEGKLEAGKTDTTYENIGFFTQILEGAINNKFMADVGKKVGEVVSNKMRSLVVADIGKKINNDKRHQLTEAIKEAFNDAQQQIAQHGNFRVELKDDLIEEMKANHSISFSTMYLNGLEKFRLEDVNIEKKNHKIMAQLVLTVDEASGSTLLSVHHQYKTTEPFQKINLGFKATGLKARVTMTKDVSGSSGNTTDSSLEVADISVDVGDVRTHMEEHYQGDVRHVIEHQMPEMLKRSLSKTLRGKMYDVILAYMFKGVVPPTSPQQ